MVPPWGPLLERVVASTACGTEPSSAPPRAAASPPSPGDAPPECGFVHEVDERPLAVDLDHRQPLAIRRLEGGVAGDVDLGELEAAFGGEGGKRLAGALAEMALGRVVKDDQGRYG